MSTEENDQQETLEIHGAPVSHNLYAVAMSVNDKYGHIIVASSWTICTEEEDKYDVYDKCMKMCYHFYPVEKGYTGHNANSTLIPREIIGTVPSGDTLKYRVHIVGVERIKKEEEEEE